MLHTLSRRSHLSDEGEGTETFTSAGSNGEGGGGKDEGGVTDRRLDPSSSAAER